MAEEHRRRAWISKTELWEVYWHLNPCKAQLMMHGGEVSLCKEERGSMRRVKRAWAS